MGTWGPGNFDNDSANDYVDELSHELAARIDKCFASEDGCALEEEGEGVLMPTVEILSVLCECCSGLPPKLEIVNGWRHRYLEIYDDEIDYLDPSPGHKSARRQVIVDTFAKLEEQARVFEASMAQVRLD